MYISEIKVENFRVFGAGADGLVMPLRPGLTAIVGENDSGKTAVIDAIRFALGTRDQEFMRLEVSDFHQPKSGGERADQIAVRLIFSGLTLQDKAAFAEHLTYIEEGGETKLIVTWLARRNTGSSTRKFMPTEWRTGAAPDGPSLDPQARSLLMATYLRPLRDAERAMSSGRGSRLSHILQHTKEVKESGVAFDKKTDATPDPKTLSVLGLGDYANYLLGNSKSIRDTRTKLNDDYLAPLSFAHDLLNARIGVSGSRDDSVRLRQLLEKLDVTLAEGGDDDGDLHSRGLGSNNLLFMACELLLLASESEGFPLLLIEEPEAHLHPQRQSRLMAFLREQASKVRADSQQIQIIVTTHSPNLASQLKLDDLVLLHGRGAFSLAPGKTELTPSDYRFLERFLDVTKANLFFARSVLIVEGDAEAIMLPVVARLLGRDFHLYGTSVVNVGGVGLGRYARIFIRSNPIDDGVVNLPVACITDMDVMPDCAPWIVGKLEEGEQIPVLGKGTRRKWRVESDYAAGKLEKARLAKRNRACAQMVDTFVSTKWTFEYDLAFSGLAEEVWVSAALALSEEKISNGEVTQEAVKMEAAKTYLACVDGKSMEVAASLVYARFELDGASKAVGAQYLASILEDRIDQGLLSHKQLCERLPAYILHAIEYVTEKLSDEGDVGAEASQ